MSLYGKPKARRTQLPGILHGKAKEGSKAAKSTWVREQASLTKINHQKTHKKGGAGVGGLQGGLQRKQEE